MNARPALWLSVALSGALGCAASPSATAKVDCSDNFNLEIQPVSGSADSTAAAPGNQQKFGSYLFPGSKPGCASPQVVAPVTAQWKSSDPLDVSVNSGSDFSANGLATCTGMTGSPVSLTATYTAVDGTTQTATAALTCK